MSAIFAIAETPGDDQSESLIVKQLGEFKLSEGEVNFFFMTDDLNL